MKAKPTTKEAQALAILGAQRVMWDNPFIQARINNNEKNLAAMVATNLAVIDKQINLVHLKDRATVNEVLSIL